LQQTPLFFESIVTNTQPNILEARQIHFAYKDREVLNDFSISVSKGEIFGLLGPNGSGKSTFLRLLCGFDRASSGTFTFEGAEFTTPSKEFRQAVGVVFQSPSLDDKLSAWKNLCLAGRSRGLPAKVVEEQATDLLSRVGLTDRADDLVGTFSGGMKRKLDLARALLHRPRILLMDEPSSGLDEASFRSLWSHLKQLQAEIDLTVIVATHRPEEADYCHRLAVLQSGRIQKVESPDQMRKSLAQDLLVFEGKDTETLASNLEKATGLAVRVDGNQVMIECGEGSTMIPTLMSQLPEGSVTAVSLRQPGLGDAFLKLTGVSLASEEEGGR
jgi:ABC-2 type transport system ATP-binding protein